MLAPITGMQDDVATCSPTREHGADNTSSSLRPTLVRVGAPGGLDANMGGITGLAQGIRNLRAAGTGIAVSVSAAHFCRPLRTTAFDRQAHA